ncbi:MAG: sigma-70 family RNA polymerase sigma factor [Clostridia bacterium]|nr:sigma-70 family RNA polymerase sigma factor [Clostridia bacterium]
MAEALLNREEFIKDNLGLVHSICRRFSGRGIDYDDLYQAGCVGLIKAVDAFDIDRGFAFSTYAVPVIMGEVRRLFRDGGAVKVSRGVKELYLKVVKANEILQQNLNREPTVSEIAEFLKVDANDVSEALCASQATVSLTVEKDSGISEMDLPVIDHQEEINNKIIIEAAAEYLTEKERLILKYRYFDLFTQSKTARLLNMTQVQVSRAEKRILLKMRHIIGNV